MDSILYPIADALGLPLNVVGAGYKGEGAISKKLAGWDIAFNLRIKSDVLTNHEASVFIQVKGNLWLYMVSYRDGAMLDCFVFDSSILKMASGYMATPCVNGSLLVSLKAMQDKAVQRFTFNKTKSVWEESNLKTAIADINPK